MEVWKKEHHKELLKAFIALLLIASNYFMLVPIKGELCPGSIFDITGVALYFLISIVIAFRLIWFMM